MNEVILDVREKDEFEAEHIENAIHVPLSQLALVAPGVLNQLQSRDLVIMCRSGKRAMLAAQQIEQMGFADKIQARVFEGGMLEWKRQGNPTVELRRGHLPIMRQVQLGAGLMVMTSAALAATLNPWFLGVTLFVGAGLTVAGATGFCGMAELLSLMPWNKGVPGAREQLCQASPNSPGCGRT